MTTRVKTANPVGKVVVVEGLESLLTKMKEEWDAFKTEAKKIQWSAVASFFLNCLDELIVMLVQTELSGPDKKATVLNAIAKLYDYVISPMFPLWMKPFTGAIRAVLLDQVTSVLIDWIVAKYSNGNWTKD